MDGRGEKICTTGRLLPHPAALGRMAATNSYHGKLRDELLNGAIFYTLKEAKSLAASGDGIPARVATWCPWISASGISPH